MRRRRGLLLGLVVLLAGCHSSSDVCEPYTDPTPRLAVISAYEPEFQEIKKRTSIGETYIINGRSFHTGQLEGNDVVVFMSGVSMVNAAMTTQTALDHFHINGIVVSGIAGGVNPVLSIGDVVVPEQWGKYQEQLFARETSDGWELGWHTDDYSNYGMMFPQRVSVTRSGGRPDAEKTLFWFPVDEEMLSVARQVAPRAELQRCTSRTDCLGSDPLIVAGGNGVSGPTFVDNAAYRDWVWESFQANALDMETAAVAHVAYANDVPYIAFRSLSDLAGGGPGANEMGVFYKLASANSAEVVVAFLQAWQER